MFKIVSFFGLALFWILMLRIVLPYTSGKTDIDFLQSKQHVIHLMHYRWSFYMHIFSSLYILGAGLTQFSEFILKRSPSLHRWIGKGYVVLILLISAPAGFVMAYYSNGSMLTHISFMLLSALWFFTTWKSYDAIKNQKDINKHRIWMIRSYALTLSAITLRIMQFSISTYADFLTPEEAYNLIAYPSWLMNVILAEIYISKSKPIKLQNLKSQ